MTSEPVSEVFGLSRANYYVMPRVLLEAMPIEWQERWAALQYEIGMAFVVENMSYKVYRVAPDQEADAEEPALMDPDPLAEYRHPDMALINGLRRRRLDDA